jgi:cation diffusion facilitator CzcD-associated flavoprotein CzcO
VTFLRSIIRLVGFPISIPFNNGQFTWARNPNWTHFYSYATEIWQYLRDVVDEYNLEKYMKLKHEVIHALWNEEQGVWEVSVKNLSTGEVFIDTAEILVNGSGVLNNWKWPEIEGLHDFEGTICHTAAFNTKTDLTGKRVAVIGMGSSGIQVTAEIAPYVEHLYTWIRSPTWITAGFAQNHAGPNGANFECEFSYGRFQYRY